ncbi:MAG: tRNA-guanine transglycosylase, partial [Candidatus Yanofskybacteria bacterium]|nr:tRNA-guanine transglycosylase [Candidatus Yanofskybacteria bacterium]
MNKLFFTITKKNKETQARLGVLKTPHGNIQTPSYVIVATHAKIKCLRLSDIKRTKTQVIISNTYHLWDKALKNKKEKHLVHKLLGASVPIMTDSGGFQVFSLGFGRENRVGKILKPVDNRLAKSVIHRRKNIKITEKGVYFSIDGEKKRFLGPKLSIKLQEKLGADMIFAFDECTSPLDSYAYNK